MDVQEAYQQAQPHLYSEAPNSASRLEIEAENKRLPTLWLSAAGAHARTGNKGKFAEALRNAALISEDTVVHTLAGNVEKTYDLIHQDITEITDSARKIFAKQILNYFKKEDRNYTVEQLVEGLKDKPTHQYGNHMTISSTNLTFEAYKLATPKDEKKYEERVESLTRCHLRLTSGKENNIGWVITIV